MTEFPDIELDPKKNSIADQLICRMNLCGRDMGEALQLRNGEWERWIPFHDRLDNVTIPACKKMLDYFRANNMYVTYGRIAACWITVKIAVQYRNPKDGTECCFR